MIAVKISYQLFHYFIILFCWVSYWIGSLRITYIHKYNVSCTLVYCLYIYTILQYVHVWGGAYKYLFSSRGTESQCAECAVRYVYMC
jgi:hypothetical protein